MKDYEQQAADFLSKHKIKLTAKFKGESRAPWRNESFRVQSDRNNKFRVYLTRAGKKCSFDFYDSTANYRAGKNTLDNYSVLACCSAESSCPDSYGEFLSEFGYSDCGASRVTFRALKKMAEKMQNFFGAEIDELCEIVWK